MRRLINRIADTRLGHWLFPYWVPKPVRPRRSFRQRLQNLGRMLLALLKSGRRLLVFFAVLLLMYLLQVTVIPYFKVGSIPPNLLLASGAVIMVCYGRLRAYWTGAVYGVLTEITLAELNYLNLVLYPVVLTFASVFFADKNEKQLEQEKSVGKAGENRNVYLRTLGAAAFCAVLKEAVNIGYMFLGNDTLSADQLLRGLTAVVLTVLCTAVIMVPLRWVLGFPIRRAKPKATRGRYIA